MVKCLNPCKYRYPTDVALTPFRARQFGFAALDGTTVVLGEVGGGPSVAWLVEGDPMATGAAE